MSTGLKRCVTLCNAAQLISITAFLMSANGCNTDVYKRHFIKPLPKGSQMLNYHEDRAGWSDMTYGFAFSVPDEAFKNQLVDDWGLHEDDNRGRKVDLDRYSLPWWPKPEERAQMEFYTWQDMTAEEFKCLWYSKDKQRLYIQYGNW